VGKTGQHGVFECFLGLRTNLEGAGAGRREGGRAQFSLIEVIAHAGVELGDLFAVGLVAEEVVLLGVVVAQVIVADLAVQGHQTLCSFH
jgi:hypothetical protein